MSDTTDPIDGLIRYVNEIKPFHSKIIEVLTEYVYEEDLDVTMDERALLDEGVFVGGVPVEDNESDQYGGSYGTGPYDNASYFPIISYNTTIDKVANGMPVVHEGAFTTDPAHATKRGYDEVAKSVIIPDNQTATYRPGRSVVLELYIHDELTGTETIVGSPKDLSIVASEYVTVGQTNGIFDTPHTKLTFSNSLIVANPATLSSDEHFSAKIFLKPSAVIAVVTSDYSDSTTNTSRIRYTTVPAYGDTQSGTRPYPGPLVNPLFEPSTFNPSNPTEPTVEGDGNITKFSNYIVLADDTTGSYPFGATLILLLNSGESRQYSVVSSYYDPNTTYTYVELLQELDVDTDYYNVQVVEGFFGLSDQYVIPTISDNAIPEGLTQTNISEGIRFSYRDTITNVEVMDFAQFLLRETIAPNSLIITGDGRDPENFFQVGQTINVVEQFEPAPAAPFTPSPNNGNHVVTAINTIPTGYEIKVSSTITSNTDTGFLETTN